MLIKTSVITYRIGEDQVPGDFETVNKSDKCLQHTHASSLKLHGN